MVGGPVAARFGLFLSILLAAHSLAREFPVSLTVWNVGQGQWVTLADERGCWHFDMGGEFAPWAAIMRECRARRNFVWLSHWDSDHVSFTGSARRILPDICFLGRPSGEASFKKLSRLRGARDCGFRVEFAHWDGADKGTANERSRVALADGVLIPGDSTRRQEKTWVHALKEISSAKILVLGHHGSRTSTSKDLLKVLRLNMAIASARFRRYGHPHAEVRAQLLKARVPLLKTEDWGTIRIEL
jgi:competence protein ComEC